MSLCWKIYHFFHHKFSKNTNKPPQMHRPVIFDWYSEKKKIAKKCLFRPPRGCEKMVIFHTSHLQKKIILISSLFFWRCDVWKITIFSQPRGGQKRHFLHNFFFFLNIHSDHRSVHLGWFIWVFWEFMVEKMINFPAQWHIKEF